jgi:hypothetical protein
MLLHMLNFIDRVITAIGFIFWVLIFLKVLEKVGEKTNNYFIGISATILIIFSMFETVGWIIENI